MEEVKLCFVNSDLNASAKNIDQLQPWQSAQADLGQNILVSENFSLIYLRIQPIVILGSRHRLTRIKSFVFRENFRTIYLRCQPVCHPWHSSQANVSPNLLLSLNFWPVYLKFQPVACLGSLRQADSLTVKPFLSINSWLIYLRIQPVVNLGNPRSLTRVQTFCVEKITGQFT